MHRDLHTPRALLSNTGQIKTGLEILMSSICVLPFRNFTIRFEGEVVWAFEARKARELVSYLLLNQERPDRRQLLMTLLWEDSSDTRAQKYLRQILWQLQSDLAPYFLKVEQQPLLVDMDWVQINPHAGT